ncbi:MAG: D-alanine--D-alanine ligase [Actinobacteria bacterium]|nr:D-alanine--D-alanine ligase [Actinomycetota bacterium]
MALHEGPVHPGAPHGAALPQRPGPGRVPPGPSQGGAGPLPRPTLASAPRGGPPPARRAGRDALVRGPGRRRRRHPVLRRPGALLGGHQPGGDPHAGRARRLDHPPPDGPRGPPRRWDRGRAGPGERGPRGPRGRRGRLRASAGEGVSPAPRKRRVAILFGGRSAEHEVSVVSAGSVIRALDPERYEAVPIGITREGTWHLMAAPPALVPGSGRLPGVAEGSGIAVELAREGDETALVSAEGLREPIDVVFPILHGPYGEDGTVQGMLELAGIPYVGAGVLASAVGMDKAVQKVLFRAAGLPVVEHEVVHERDWEEDREAVEARAGHLGYPIFAKPATLGSSVGITKVGEPGRLVAALELAFRYAGKALLERAVEGAREIECAVLGNDDPVASLPGEIVPGGEFYDYRAKYLDEEGTRLIVPADLPEEVVEEVQRMAVAAFRAIDCSGMARVDFFFREPRDLILNEINTIPGFTSVSMYPKMWEASGLPYPELIDRLVELAVERHQRDAKRGTALDERT